MFLLVPLRVEGAAVDRVPVVSITIAALCIALFVATWVLPEAPLGVSPGEKQEVIDYWAERPWLELPPTFSERFLDARAVRLANEGRKQQLKTSPEAGPREDVRAEGQRYLNDLGDRAVALQEQSALWRWSLVPARGPLQPGWLLHLFLHFGWLHLIGNLLFFYLTAPLLEDVWGRRFFAGFYLACGVLSGLAQVIAMWGAMSMLAGASGAIAGCMGAFSRRMAGREVRMGYLVLFFTRLLRGTFLVPAWCWGLGWFAHEAWTFVSGTNGSVAVVAHLGGFAAGFLAALWLEKSGYEARALAPAVERATVYKQHEGIDQARAALSRNDRNGARDAFDRVLREQPGDLESLGGSIWLQLEAGDVAGGTARLGRELPKLVRAKRDEAAAQLLIDTGPLSDLKLLPVRTLRPLRASISRLGYGFDHLGERLDLALSGQHGPVGARALIRQAGRLIARGEGVAAARLIDGARERVEVPPELRDRLDELGEQASGLPRPGAAKVSKPGTLAPLRDPDLEAEENTNAALAPSRRERSMDLPEAGPELEMISSRAAAPTSSTSTSAAASATRGPTSGSFGPAATGSARATASGGAVRVLACRIAGLHDEAIDLVATNAGKERTLLWSELLAVGAGMVAAGEGGKLLLVTDLVVALGDAATPPAVLRISGAEHELAQHFPGVATKQAYATLLTQVLERSGAWTLAPQEALLRGELPRTADLAAHNAALVRAIAGRRGG